MSTSANVIEYIIEKDGVEVGHHRENVMCHSHYEKLLKFEPLNEHTITPWGYDEEEEEWYGDTENLEDYLRKKREKPIVEYFTLLDRKLKINKINK